MTADLAVAAGNDLARELRQFRSPMTPILKNRLREWVIPVNSCFPHSLKEDLGLARNWGVPSKDVE